MTSADRIFNVTCDYSNIAAVNSDTSGRNGGGDIGGGDSGGGTKSKSKTAE